MRCCLDSSMSLPFIPRPFQLPAMILFQTFIFANNRISGELCPALEGLKLLVRMGSIVCKHRAGYLELVTDISAPVYLHQWCARGLAFRFTRGGDPYLGCDMSCCKIYQNIGDRPLHFPIFHFVLRSLFSLLHLLVNLVPYRNATDKNLCYAASRTRL